MDSLRQLPVQPRRDAWVEINLGALEENARLIRRLIPENVELMAIVKADAYGHGAAMVLPTLEASGVKMAGVASMDEAIHLRQSGIRMPVLVLGGVPDWTVRYAAREDIRLSIFDEHHLDILSRAAAHETRPFKVHVKIDTGMHRIGMPWEKAAQFIAACQKLDFIEVEGMFSHLADSTDGPSRALQLERWAAVRHAVKPLPHYVHISNSLHALESGVFQSPQGNGLGNNLARLGLAFFGYGLPAGHAEGELLKPVLGLKARILHIQEVAEGTGISYGHTHRTQPLRRGDLSRIATVPLGYADGVPRCLSNKIEGLLAGRRVSQVGTITMDQMMFDISAVPEALIGDSITLLGREEPDGEAIWLDEWARHAGTIEYELMCALRVRLPKTYIR